MRRVGNSLLVFLSKAQVFWERKSIIAVRSFFKANCSFALLLFCKEWQEQIAQVGLYKRAQEQSDGGDWLLGIWMGKTVKNIKNTNFLGIACFYASDLLKSQANHSHGSFLKSYKTDLLMMLFCLEPWEWFAYGCSLKWATLSKRVKSEWAKEWIPNPANAQWLNCRRLEVLGGPISVQFWSAYLHLHCPCGFPPPNERCEKYCWKIF